jgi:hypothetical protein
LVRQQQPDANFRQKEATAMTLHKVFLTIAVSGTILSFSTNIPKVVADDAKTTANPSKYSDRDQMKSSRDDKGKLEQELKTGEEKAFYRRELEKMGWHITSVNYDKPDYVEYEIVKGDRTFEVQIDFDKNSHKANKVDVVWNAWKTDATENALKHTQARR